MKTSELIFGRLCSDPEFLNDLKFFAELPRKDLDKVLAVYLESKYRYSWHNTLGKFSKKIDFPFEETHTISHLLDLFSYRVAIDFEIKEIMVAVNELLKSTTNNLEKFLETLKLPKTREVLEIMDLVDDEIGVINPHLRDLTFSIQKRVVMKENKLLKEIPIVTLQLNTNKNKGTENVIELLDEDIDELIEALEAIKTKIKIVGGE